MCAMSVREVSERYALLRELKPGTVQLYNWMWDRFDTFLGRPATVDDFDDMVVARFLKWRAETCRWGGRPLTPATIRKDRTMLAAVWTYAARKRWAAEFPELPRIRVPKKLPVGRAYTLADVEQLIRAAKKRIGKTGGLPSKWWWSTLIYAAVCSGERASALMSLRWGQVDLERRRLTFLGATRKGATRDIQRPITQELADMLARFKGPDDSLVWPWDRRSKSQWASLKVLCDSAKVKYRGFHGFRRTAASYAALAHGRAAASELLDHSDAALQEVYVDPLICPTGVNEVVTLPPLHLGDGPRPEHGPDTAPDA